MSGTLDRAISEGADRLAAGVPPNVATEHTLEKWQPGTPAALLDDMAAFVRKYVAFARLWQLYAVVLWVLHTWCHDAFDVSPILAITSPEKRSGKTRLLDALALLVAKPWRCVTPSEAVTFRKIAADKPTMLLDEFDCVFNLRSANHEGLRALLNAGNQSGTTVPRCVGENSKLKIQEFNVYCPKALAGIGDLPDTVADRSIPIRLARRKPTEQVAKFRRREAEMIAAPLRDRLEAWAFDAAPSLENALSMAA